MLNALRGTALTLGGGCLFILSAVLYKYEILDSLFLIRVGMSAGLAGFFCGVMVVFFYSK